MSMRRWTLAGSACHRPVQPVEPGLARYDAGFDSRMIDRSSLACDHFNDATAAPDRRPRRSGAAPPRRARLRRSATALLWFIYGVIAKSSQDLNADMAEMVVWTRELALGYPKHPPLLAWILWALVQDLPARRLGLHPARGRHARRPASFWRSSSAAEWLAREKLAAVPFLLAAIPFYNFLGLKWDQNSVLIPLWALAMWAMLRALDDAPSRLGGARRARGRGRDADEILVGVSASSRSRFAALADPKRARLFPLRRAVGDGGRVPRGGRAARLVADRARTFRRSPG